MIPDLENVRRNNVLVQDHYLVAHNHSLGLLLSAKERGGQNKQGGRNLRGAA